jgi:chemotaxis protein MotB
MRKESTFGIRSSSHQRITSYSGFALSLAFLLVGCGHTEQEWQAQLDKYNELGQRTLGQQAELDKTKAEVARLNAELGKQQTDLNSEQSRAGDLQKLLDAAKEQAALLDRIKARFAALREKLKGLTEIGLEVTIRHNKMVISLPGDVLFAAGSAKLSKSGERALSKVKKVLLSDPSLAERYYQVAGHTDNQQLVRTAEEFKDNWGLSLMRARDVLLYLTNAETGGGLNVKHWSAAGYAEIDPVAPNSSAEARRRNRRVEVVVQPDVEEMLDLKSLANTNTVP